MIRTLCHLDFMSTKHFFTTRKSLCHLDFISTKQHFFTTRKSSPPLKKYISQRNLLGYTLNKIKLIKCMSICQISSKYGLLQVHSMFYFNDASPLSTRWRGMSTFDVRISAVFFRSTATTICYKQGGQRQR